MNNRRPQRCQRCGELVPPGEGDLERRETPDGRHEWVVTHTEPCEARRQSDDGVHHLDQPLWAEYVDGGVRFVMHTTEPTSVPLNQAARDVDARRAEGESDG